MVIENELLTLGEGGASSVWLLCGARLLGLILTAPFFSSRLIPFRLRAAFVVLLVAALFSQASSPWTPESAAALREGTLSLFLVSELFVGMALGWTALLVLAAVRAAAVLISEQVGFAFGGIVDPSTDQEEPVLQGLYVGLALFVLLAGDVHHLFLRSVVESFASLPPGALVLKGALAGLGTLLVAAGTLLFEATLILVFPVSAALFLASVAQGILTRLFPELETVLFGFLLRCVVALGVVTLALPLFVEACERLFGDSLAEGKLVLRKLAG